MILISIPVHENPEVILDQISNFRKFAPEAFLVIHPSRQLLDRNPEIRDMTSGIEGVSLNPNPIYTGFTSVLKCHVSNCLHAATLGIPFSHICLHSSNELFVRHGMEGYVRSNDFGFFKFDMSENPFHCHWKPSFLEDSAYRNLMNEANFPLTQFKTQAEGSFYPMADFIDFSERFMRSAWSEFPWIPRYTHGLNRLPFDFMEKFIKNPKRRRFVKGIFYPREEYYPSNYFANKCENPASPYCYINWANNLQVTRHDVDEIRNGTIFRDGNREYFSVKRVDRKIDDPLRTLIRRLD